MTWNDEKSFGVYYLHIAAGSVNMEIRRQYFFLKPKIFMYHDLIYLLSGFTEVYFGILEKLHLFKSSIYASDFSMAESKCMHFFMFSNEQNLKQL